MTDKIKILFLCSGNSWRSQVAEGLARHLRGDECDAFSAGIEPRGLDPRAIKAMAEAGIDISSQRSKNIDSLGSVEFDYVITLCDKDRESCPYYPARTKLIHQGFDDPPSLSQGSKGEEEAMGHYRRVRDEIKVFVEKFPEALQLH